MMTKDSIIQKLKQRGLRITPQRLAIVEVLIEKGHLHPGARFIYKEAKKKSRSLCLATTYATINEFSRYGIIKTLQFDGVENRCEGNLDEHINLICERCGKIIDYKIPISVDQKDVRRKTGFIITNNRLEYYGYCRDCRQDKKRSQVL
ncbi:MAG: Fur family transcriptional regulator [Syntrophales bacterium]|jgi:Fur family peroxide stress response transcriptional regulator